MTFDLNPLSRGRFIEFWIHIFMSLKSYKYSCTRIENYASPFDESGRFCCTVVAFGALNHFFINFWQSPSLIRIKKWVAYFINIQIFHIIVFPIGCSVRVLYLVYAFKITIVNLKIKLKKIIILQLTTFCRYCGLCMKAA